MKILDNPASFIESNLTVLYLKMKNNYNKRSTDKGRNLKDNFDKAIDNLSIILDSENLEKKSKISFFEKIKIKFVYHFTLITK